MRLFPDPGILPTKNAPKRGEVIAFRVTGLPPYKELRASLRNAKHPQYRRFVRLRRAATQAMKGRKWGDGGIALDVTLVAPRLDTGKHLTDYVAGIDDTLDGSHGDNFTYLPIVFQDDCQVVRFEIRFECGERAYYVVKIRFL